MQEFTGFNRVEFFSLFRRCYATRCLSPALESKESWEVFQDKVDSENIQELVFKASKFLEEDPDLGDKDYPLKYLEGQALKERILQEAKGRGFDWE